MVSAPYERKNKKTENIAVRAVKAYISTSILPTYGRFSRGRSHIYIYIYMFFIYIYIYTSVRRARAVNARATRKRQTGRLRFNGQYNRLENGYFSSKL